MYHTQDAHGRLARADKTATFLPPPFSDPGGCVCGRGSRGAGRDAGELHVMKVSIDTADTSALIKE